MSRRDFFLVASIAAICSLLAYLAGAAATTPPEVLRCESSASHENHAMAFSKPDDKAAHVKSGSHGRDAALALQQDSSVRDSGNHAESSAAQDAAAFQKRQELEDRFSHLFNSGGNPDPSVTSARIENRFYSEEWNQAWAGSRERNIKTLFETNKVLSGVAPLQVTCRSKNCQVVFSASNQDQIRLISERFMQAATRGDVGMKDKVVSFFPDISMGRVVFYLSDNGNMDLFQ